MEATALTRSKPIPKSDGVFWRQVRRYIRRHGGTTDEARDRLELMRYSGARPVDQRLAEAMKAEGMNKTCQKMARDGYWADFKGPLGYPKVELAKMLRSRGRIEFAERVEAGEFDD